jgi:hypothetical protein
VIAAAPSRARIGWIVAAGIGAALMALAFAVAPRACAGGLEIYGIAGLVALPALAAVPFAAGIGGGIARRLGVALGFVALGVATWLAGLLLANVRFICGLGYL